MFLLLSLLLPASAAEVVWLDEAPADAQVILDAAGSTSAPLSVRQLVGRATTWTDADAERFAKLQSALREARTFEQRLDGERIIMADLQGPLDSIQILPDSASRHAVFSALTYQGFAVHRYFEDTLAEAEGAAPYRQTFEDRALVTPWLRAAALEPDRAVTAYEIGEAPQRIAYEEVRSMVGAALPGTIQVGQLAQTDKLVVDARTDVQVTAGAIRVRPGRHWIHLERDGQIIGYTRVDIAAGERMTVALTPPVEGLNWLEALAKGELTDLPKGLANDLDTVGREVWLVTASGAWRYADGQVQELDRPKAEKVASSNAVQLAFTGAAGWLGSQDFYNQDPVSFEPTSGTVNAGAVVLGAEAAMGMSGFELAAGVDTWITLGAPHVARFGGATTRVRPHAWVGAGLSNIKLTVGMALPHHAAAGLRARLPLTSGLELTASALGGLAVVKPHPNGTWKGAPISAASLGVGWRL